MTKIKDVLFPLVFFFLIEIFPPFPDVWHRAASLIAGLSSWRWSTAANVYICRNRLHGSFLAWCYDVEALEIPRDFPENPWWQGPRDFPATLFFMQLLSILPKMQKMLCWYLFRFFLPDHIHLWKTTKRVSVESVAWSPSRVLGSAVYECLWSWRGHISSVLYCCRRDGNLRGKGERYERDRAAPDSATA